VHQFSQNTNIGSRIETPILLTRVIGHPEVLNCYRHWVTREGTKKETGNGIERWREESECYYCEKSKYTRVFFT